MRDPDASFHSCDSPSLQPLSAVPSGSTVTVRQLVADDDAGRRLSELGLGSGGRVRVVCNDDPFVCQVGECRLGICRRLARCVLVEPVNSPA